MDHSLQGSVDRDSRVPLGLQLADRIRAAVADGHLTEGERLPSVRELAESAAVNVNTVRATYARLEADGVVRSEHGRGTFVAGASAPSRRQVRDQIAALEATLARLPPPPVAGGATRTPAATLLSTEELLDVRDRLLTRLQQLDSERSALIESFEQLGFERPSADAQSRRATPSLAGARIRWVGA